MGFELETLGMSVNGLNHWVVVAFDTRHKLKWYLCTTETSLILRVMGHGYHIIKLLFHVDSEYEIIFDVSSIFFKLLMS